MAPRIPPLQITAPVVDDPNGPLRTYGFGRRPREMDVDGNAWTLSQGLTPGESNTLAEVDRLMRRVAGLFGVHAPRQEVVYVFPDGGFPVAGRSNGAAFAIGDALSHYAPGWRPQGRIVITAEVGTAEAEATRAGEAIRFSPVGDIKRKFEGIQSDASGPPLLVIIAADQLDVPEDLPDRLQVVRARNLRDAIQALRVPPNCWNDAHAAEQWAGTKTERPGPGVPWKVLAGLAVAGLAALAIFAIPIDRLPPDLTTAQRSMLDADPDRLCPILMPEILAMRGEQARREQQGCAAVARCEALTAHPLDPDLLRAAGSGTGVDGETLRATAAQAIAACGGALAIFPHATRTLWHMARIREVQGQDREAQTLIDQAAQRGSPMARLRLTTRWRYEGDLAGAREELRRLTERDPPPVAALINLAQMTACGQGGMADPSEARRLLEGAERILLPLGDAGLPGGALGRARDMRDRLDRDAVECAGPDRP
ncbi:MAG: tetratricopeptide repeat protein [Alphaproteobacteria bacterium]|jgi:hypothetical protein